MGTVVVIVMAVFLIAAACGDGGGGGPESPGAEQLRRDTEDIAIYGAVVRPPLEDEGP